MLWQCTGFEGSNFIEIQGNNMQFVQELALYIYIHVYVLKTGISLLFEKQKQGKACKPKQRKDVVKAGKTL